MTPPVDATPPSVFSIGYEKRSLGELIDALRSARVAQLIDVRAVAASRRAGFAKSKLAAGLAEAGLRYVHLRALGTPKPGRDAARKGRVSEMRAIFAAHLATPEALDAFAQLEALVAEAPSALLCFEADAEGCHRLALVERLAERLGVAATHL